MEDAVDSKVKVLSLWYSADRSQALKQSGELKVTELRIEDAIGVRGIVLYENNKVPQLVAKVKETILVENDEYIFRIDSLHVCNSLEVCEPLRCGELQHGTSNRIATIELKKVISLCDDLPFSSPYFARDFITLAGATEMLARTYGVSKEQVRISISNEKLSGQVAKVVGSDIS